MTVSGTPVSPLTFAVELTAYELRALVNTAALLEGVLGDHDVECIHALPEGHSIRPLQSAQLKLEMALVLAREER